MDFDGVWWVLVGFGWILVGFGEFWGLVFDLF